MNKRTIAMMTACVFMCFIIAGSVMIGVGAMRVTRASGIGDSPPWNLHFMYVAAGMHHSLGITHDGRLFAWGSNNRGQLGDGTEIARSIPVHVMPGTRFAQVAAGWNVSFAICEDGRLFAWGGNYVGQLGDGTTINRSYPVQIMNGTYFTRVSSGINRANAFAIDKDGRLYGWGENWTGQLGNGTTIPQRLPVHIDVPNITFKYVSTGNGFSVALDAYGQVFTWGGNYGGTLGDGTFENRLYPAPIKSDARFSKISAGDGFVVGITKDDGRLYGWGENWTGQLGNGTYENENEPIRIMEGTRFANVAAGSYHALAITMDGHLYTWGANWRGELGDGTIIDRNTPMRIMEGTLFRNIAGGEILSLAITDDGRLFSWGCNAGGQLGDGVIHFRYTPTRLMPGVGFDYVTVSYSHALGITSEGFLYVWGSNLLFDNDYGFGTPIRVMPGTTFRHAAAGAFHSLAIDEDGRLFSWGANGLGQLGDGTTIGRHVPAQIMEGYTFRQVATNQNHSFAITTNGRLFGWGQNTGRQLGIQSNANMPTPVEILIDDGTWGEWSHISAGGEDSFALDVAGRLFMLGPNSVPNRPVHILPDNVFSHVWASTGTRALGINGQQHVHAIEKDGRRFSWGANGSGQLGDGTTERRTSPTYMQDDFIFSYIAGGSINIQGAPHSLGISQDGRLFSWGGNRFGQLGDGTQTNRSLPIQIMQGTTFGHIAASNEVSFAITADGSLYAWGWNRESRIGEFWGDRRLTPTLIAQPPIYLSDLQDQINAIRYQQETNLYDMDNLQYKLDNFMSGLRTQLTLDDARIRALEARADQIDIDLEDLRRRLRDFSTSTDNLDGIHETILQMQRQITTLNRQGLVDMIEDLEEQLEKLGVEIDGLGYLEDSNLNEIRGQISALENALAGMNLDMNDVGVRTELERILTEMTSNVLPDALQVFDDRIIVIETEISTLLDELEDLITDIVVELAPRPTPEPSSGRNNDTLVYFGIGALVLGVVVMIAGTSVAFVVAKKRRL